MATKQQQTVAVEELRKLDSKALTQKLADLRQQIVEQQRSLAAQELPSTAVIRKTRRTIAQVITIMNELQQNPGTAASPSEAKKEEEQ